ncbi:NHL repeat protein [Legionella birminghamensis]|uniref:NHL repeat protein n=1 Tax=Legionella birminghamensis TaxID=28083 RepID=A0A378I6S4_9GAMM|nr:hypothetical protein [Legionella birminghamensis]KTC73799.1 NHL repeat protein [Legionella birminghamensis]STX30703.1 NHL repeat protein [Legionella birminghamensis]
MNNIKRLFTLSKGLILFFISGLTQAGSPVFTMTPQTPVALQLKAGQTATVKYLVTNQSLKMHSIVLKPIPGIRQLTGAGICPSPFTLTAKQSCILSLEVIANQLPGRVTGGPIICQVGPDGSPSPFLCNQPSPLNSLNITVHPINQYTVSSSAGNGGNVSPAGTQTVNSGSSLSFTATPSPNFAVYQWIVDGGVAQTGGSSFTLSNIVANHQLQVTFTDNTLLYSGAQNGNLYYSFNGGGNWQTTAQMPGGGSAINSLWLNPLVIYTGNANGFVYFSTNNGSSWQQSTSPDGSAVNAVFVYNNILYAGTASGLIYSSANNGSSWSPLAPLDGSPVDAVFISAAGFYAGTGNGNVYYSANNGLSWTAINGQVDGSAVKGVYVANNSLFVNTANEYVYSSTELTGGGNWTAIAQTVFSLFVNSAGSLFAGTQGGYVFLVSQGIELGFVAYSPINAVAVLN